MQNAVECEARTTALYALIMTRLNQALANPSYGSWEGASFTFD